MNGLFWIPDNGKRSKLYLRRMRRRNRNSYRSNSWFDSGIRGRLPGMLSPVRDSCDAGRYWRGAYLLEFGTGSVLIRAARDVGFVTGVSTVQDSKIVQVEYQPQPDVPVFIESILRRSAFQD